LRSGRLTETESERQTERTSKQRYDDDPGWGEGKWGMLSEREKNGETNDEQKTCSTTHTKRSITL